MTTKTKTWTMVSLAVGVAGTLAACSQVEFTGVQGSKTLASERTSADAIAAPVPTILPLGLDPVASDTNPIETVPPVTEPVVPPTVVPDPFVGPTQTPIPVPTAIVTVAPTPVVTVPPTVAPDPFIGPTQTPTPVPTAVVTVAPTPVVTVAPTPVVTVAPTPVVTVAPTPVVTVAPTPVVTVAPTPVVTATPAPTPVPTEVVLQEDEGPLCEANQPGFGGKVYSLPVQTKALPDFSTMTALGQVDAPVLNINRNWTLGFPGLPDLTEWFAIRFYGVFYVAESNYYGFRVYSDDGSKVYIDGNQIITNDGIHALTGKPSGNVLLAAGYHKIVVEWYQGPRYSLAMILQYRVGTTGAYTQVEEAHIRHSDICDLSKVGQFSN